MGKTRIRKYLNSPQVEKGSWISEPQFYKLAFKANNEAAEKFQDWVAGEVLPVVRKHGLFDWKRPAILHQQTFRW